MILELIDKRIKNLLNNQTKDNHREVTAKIEELIELKEDVVFKVNENKTK